MVVLPLLSFVGSAFFLIVLITINILNRDLQFKKDALSKYAKGERGWLLTLGFYSIGMSQVLLSVILANVYTFSYGLLLLAVAGSGTLLVGGFKMEFPKESIRGYLHTLGAGMQFLFFPAALILMRDQFPSAITEKITLLVGSMTALFGVYIFYVFLKGTTHHLPYFGIIQKTNILLMTVWVVLISFLEIYISF